MEFSYIYLIIGVALLLNVLLSIFLLKRDDLEKFQAYAQVLLVWLIPFVAAICLWLFYRSEDQTTRKFNSNTGSGSADTSIGSFTGGSD